MVGSIHHHGVIVSDVEQSSSFYTDVLGFTQVDSRSVATEPVEEALGVDGADLSVVMIDANGFLIELIEYNAPANENANEKVNSHDVGVAHFAVVVDDIDAVFNDIRNDVDYVSEPKTLDSLGGLKAVYLKDPDGNIIEFIEEA